ncbi:MAG: DUF2087 domain-containing protein, partial [Vitreoscilla sp.]
LADHHITHGRLPGHVEMMNLLARGAGKRNLQELQAQAAHHAPAAAVADVAAPPAPAAIDSWFDAPELLDPATTPNLELMSPRLSERAARTLKCFDFSGRLTRWPPKLSQQRLAMWVLWTRFDGRRVYTEAEVNHVLKAWHVYGDHATLRRELINHQLMTRKSDCSEYRKTPQWPDDEAQGLLRALRKRQAPYRLSNRPPRVLPAGAQLSQAPAAD